MIEENNNFSSNQLARKLKEIFDISFEFNQAKEIQDAYMNDQNMQEFTENILNHCRNKYQKVRKEIDAILDGYGK